MAAIKKSISLPEQQFTQAQTRWHQLGFTTFSDYVQELIRRDLGFAQVIVGAGHGNPALNDPGRPGETKPPNAERHVSYTKPKAKRPRRN